MYERPGHRHYATASGTHFHGAPVVYDGVPGIAFKQALVGSGAGSGDVQKTIADGEAFTIICKGRVELTNTSTWTRGTKLYISSTHVISSTGTTGTPFGLVVEVAGERGTPTGKMRVDLDFKHLG
jgi:hypothetical protein